VDILALSNRQKVDILALPKRQSVDVLTLHKKQMADILTLHKKQMADILTLHKRQKVDILALRKRQVVDILALAKRQKRDILARPKGRRNPMAPFLKSTSYYPIRCFPFSGALLTPASLLSNFPLHISDSCKVAATSLAVVCPCLMCLAWLHEGCLVPKPLNGPVADSSCEILSI
jgi:hypothetical protein